MPCCTIANGSQAIKQASRAIQAGEKLNALVLAFNLEIVVGVVVAKRLRSTRRNVVLGAAGRRLCGNRLHSVIIGDSDGAARAAVRIRPQSTCYILRTELQPARRIKCGNTPRGVRQLDTAERFNGVASVIWTENRL